MNGACPKCGHPRNADEAGCSRCGVIFARIHDAAPNAGQSEPPSISRDVFQQIATVPNERNLPLIALKTFFLVILAVYGVSLALPPIASNSAGESFLHLINLPFHEAGHIFFTPFGRFLQILGGSLLQLIVPAVVAGTFIYQGRHYPAVVGLWWLGESLLDLAPYIDDARAGQLMLLGGVTGSEVEDYHDWEGLLSRLGMMQYDHAMARLALGVGITIMLGAVGWGLWLTWREYNGAGRAA